MLGQFVRNRDHTRLGKKRASWLPRGLPEPSKVTESMSIMEPAPSFIVSRRMGCRHRDFFRNLATAVEGRSYEVVDESLIIIRERGRRLEIELREEFERVLGISLRLPVTPVVFRFFGYSDRQAKEFLRGFDRHYQRGGG